MVGVAAGRIIGFYHKGMISLAYVRRDPAVESAELTVVWGTDPTQTVSIRARVAAFSYYNEHERDETLDVEEIPHPTL